MEPKLKKGGLLESSWPPPRYRLIPCSVGWFYKMLANGGAASFRLSFRDPFQLPETKTGILKGLFMFIFRKLRWDVVSCPVQNGDQMRRGEEPGGQKVYGIIGKRRSPLSCWDRPWGPRSCPHRRRGCWVRTSSQERSMALECQGPRLLPVRCSGWWRGLKASETVEHKKRSQQLIKVTKSLQEHKHPLPYLSWS